MPKSAAATSKAHLVLVLSFSKRRTMFLPLKTSWASPLCFFFFKERDKSNKYWISSGVKSNKVNKFLLYKFIFIIPL